MCLECVEVVVVGFASVDVTEHSDLSCSFVDGFFSSEDDAVFWDECEGSAGTGEVSVAPDLDFERCCECGGGFGRHIYFFNIGVKL